MMYVSFDEYQPVPEKTRCGYDMKYRYHYVFIMEYNKDEAYVCFCIQYWWCNITPVSTNKDVANEKRY